MKGIQNTTATGWSGIVGIWLAMFGSKQLTEIPAMLTNLTLEQWASLVLPILVCARAIWFVDEESK